MTNPLIQFSQWFQEERMMCRADAPPAVCLSTIGTDGFPDSRFVALKEVVDDRFIITGPVSSRKGREIQQNNKVALCFWWEHTRRQVRVQGVANPISAAEADKYFDERDRASRIVSHISHQGKVVSDPTTFYDYCEAALSSQDEDGLKRPANWGGYAITPLRIELMEFKSNRCHKRTAFHFTGGEWMAKVLQP